MEIIDFAREIRLCVLELCYRRRTSHIGGALSIADVLAVLYGQILNVYPKDENNSERDRLFYSKGHACAALYAALTIRGFFSRDTLNEEFIADGSYFTSHVNHRIPGIELSTGSLGHALGVACGSALAGKRNSKGYTVFGILSDGELDEGSNWEAIMFAAHLQLDNLVMIIDYNKIQSFGRVSEVMTLEPLAAKLEAFNWNVQQVNGHALHELSAILQDAKSSRNGKPKCIIAHTVKGKGVSFMEDSLLWHYKSPNEADYQAARKELESCNA